MKNKTITTFLFILFAIPIPISLLGALLCFIWFLYSLLHCSHILEIILSVFGAIIGSTYIFTYFTALIKTRKYRCSSIKSFAPLIHCIIALIYLLSLSPASQYVANSHEYFGFAKKDFGVIDELNTHGGFIGDGYYRLILDCSDSKEAALKKIKDWNKMPLSANLEYIIYGGERNGTTRRGLNEEAKIPVIENGYYIFMDRSSESTDNTDDSELLSRYSFNFSIAIYDTDTDILYYFEYDT